MNRIDIVMVTYQRKTFTSDAIKAIKERTTTPYRLIVVDNCSTDGSQDMLYKMKQDGLISHLVLLEENYGIHAAKNAGFALVRPSKYYIDTDNDLICPQLEPDWIQQLIGLMDKYPNYGAITCRPQVLVGRAGTEFDVPDEVVKFSHTGAHLRIMRTELIKKVGGWEKTWEAKRNHEDSFIAARLDEIGYNVGYAKNVRCWHMFSKNWGYKDMPLADHGHREIWPPSEYYDLALNKFNTKTWQEK